MKIAAAAGVIILYLMLYLPAAHGPYLVDDFPNLVDNPALSMERWDLDSLGSAMTSSPSSTLGRPLSMLSFALNYTLAGDRDPYPVKLTNIILHLVTGTGLFLLAGGLARHWLPGSPDRAYWIALVTAGTWLLHPLQVSTVLYAVQRMTILSALFTVYGLVLYLGYRRRTLQDGTHYSALLVSLVLCTLLGVLCKENAVLLPVFALLVEVVTFRFAFHPRTPVVQKALLVSFLVVPAIFIISYLVARYAGLEGEIIEPFFYTIDQRLLTQLRVLVSYLGWILLLNPAPMSLFHTDFGLSTGWLEPATTLVSAMFLAALAGLAIGCIIKRRYLAAGFGLAWFFTGHLIESTTLPLELVFEHRNYLPSAGILLIPAYALAHAPEIHSISAGRRVLFCLLLAAVVVYLTQERVGAWRTPHAFVINLVQTKGHTPWAWSEASNLLVQAGDVTHGVVAMRRAAALAPEEAAFLLGESTIWCRYQAAFPEAHRQALTGAFEGVRVTPVTVNTFARMIASCRGNTANHQTLASLYAAASGHANRRIAELGRRALAEP